MSWYRGRWSGRRGALRWDRAGRRATALLARAAVLAGVGAVPAARGADAQQPAVASPLAFDGVTVVDVEQGKLVPDQRVVVVGNRIQAAGSTRSVPLPNGAHVVDARGKYLIPGLWDMHTHSTRMAHIFYPLFIANGVTGIRDASSEVPLDTLVLWRREILAGARVGPPRQLLSGQAIDERESCTRAKELHTCIAAGDAADARHLVDSLKAAGADMLKTYELSPEMYFILAAEARRAGLRFGGHTSVPATQASDSGVSLIDHTTLNEELRTQCLYNDASVEGCRPIAERLARNDTWWVTTWIFPPRIAGRARSRAIYASSDEFIKAFWGPEAFSRSLHEYLRREAIDAVPPSQVSPEPIAEHFTTPGSVIDSLGYLYVVNQAGLPILAGTDAAGFAPYASIVPAGFSLHTELATFAAEGLTPLEALRTATLNPAKFLRATDSLGTVAAGKLADLVLLDADPLADIANTTAIRAVVANGRYYDRAALDKLLAEARADIAREP